MGFRGTQYVSHPDVRTDDGWVGLDCGNCGRSVSAMVVGAASLKSGLEVRWLQCNICGEGTVRHADGVYSPSKTFGPALEGLPSDIHSAYEEARSCMSVGAYVATELVSRKILMHVAVEKGAEENKTFAEYVKYLADAGHVTVAMRPWVDLIRSHGNDAAHELTPVTRARAESTLMFTAELLRVTYEMESMAMKYAPAPDPEA